MPGRCGGCFARLFNGICRRISNGNYTCLFTSLDFLFRKVLGKILVFFVYAILAFLTFVVCTIVIPYESLFQPWWCLTFLVIFATYLMTSIVYHYHKASTTHPGNPPKSSQLPLCRHCQNHKPPGVHHCAICNECIVKMDHHCIWVNQCVGAKNHRHFLQFLAFIVTGCATFTVGAFNTFYHNYWRPTSNQVFCNSELTNLPWFNWFCDSSSEFIISSIFFSYFLCALVFLLVGGLFWWNFVLISAGTTYIGILKEDISRRDLFQVVCCPFRNLNFMKNWMSFLGLKQSRTFIKHILIPSGHDSYTDHKLEQQPFTGTTVV